MVSGCAKTVRYCGGLRRILDSCDGGLLCCPALALRALLREDVPLVLPVDCEVPVDMPPFAFVLAFALPLALPLTLGLELMLLDIEFISLLACDWALSAAPIAAPVAMPAAPVAVPATSGGGLLLPLPVLAEALPEAEPEPDTLMLPPFSPADMLAEGSPFEGMPVDGVPVDGMLIDGALGGGVLIDGALLMADSSADPSAVAAAFSAGPVVSGMIWVVGGTGLLEGWFWLGVGVLGVLGVLVLDGIVMGPIPNDPVPPTEPMPPTLPPRPPPPNPPPPNWASAGVATATVPHNRAAVMVLRRLIFIVVLLPSCA